MNTTRDIPNASALETARDALKRAYLLLDYGEWDAALAACDLAIESAPDAPLPRAMKGAIAAARGDTPLAVKLLRSVTRRHSGWALGHLYLAEALLLARKAGSGRRALVRARECDDFEAHREFHDLIREAFSLEMTE